mgnify:FL=1
MITVKNELKKLPPKPSESGMFDINQNIESAVEILFPILEENLSKISQKYDATVSVVGNAEKWDIIIDAENEDAKAEIEKIIIQSL